MKDNIYTAAIRTYRPWIMAGLFALVTGCQQPRGDVLDRQLVGDTLTHARFAANLRTLAMPGGRLTGTPNADAAESFVADRLREYGLSSVRLEPFEMSCWTVRHTYVTLLADPPRTLDGAVALARTMPTPPEGVTAEIIDLGAAEEAHFAEHANELAGKFVLVRDGPMRRVPTIKLACDHHAAGVIVMSQPDRDPVIGNGHRTPRPEPAVVIRHDDDLIARLDAGDPLRANIRLDVDNWDCRPANVVGELPGSGPLAQEQVILGAHLDSWHLGEGAIDNGNGSAVILETARVLGQSGWRGRRTVRFVWFMAEELGLEGSESYVRQHEGEMGDVVAMINVDMPGSPRTLAHFGHPEIEPFLRRVASSLPGYELDVKGRPAEGEWSDHAPFMKQGVCTLGLWGELGPGVKTYHTAADLYDTVDRRGTIHSAAVLAVLVRQLADEPQRPTVRLAPDGGE